MTKSFFDIISQRRSCRRYSSEAVSDEIAMQLVQAALMAPSSKGRNPWHFVVVNNRELLQKLAECKPSSSQMVALAPLAIVVAADTTASDVWIEDASIATIYLQLAAEALGLGSCWVQVRERMHNETVAASAYVQNLLAIPAQFQVEAIVAFGYKEKPQRPFDERKMLKERISLNTFGEPFGF